MQRVAGVVLVSAIAAGSSACTHHTMTPKREPAATSLGVSALAAHCDLHDSVVVAGASRDGKRCTSLRWKLARTPGTSFRFIRVLWFGNCFDGRPKASSTETAASVTIAVTTLEPYPLPNILCPPLAGRLTVGLSGPLDGRRVVHARVTQ
jgi:hypothetical protein